MNAGTNEVQMCEGMCLSPSTADQALDLVFSKDFGLLQVVRVVACSHVACMQHF